MVDEYTWEERARAAEKTVAVLKRRLGALDSGTERSLIRSQFESSQRRAMQAERRRILGEVRTAELKRYSELLEERVAERTRQVRAILDNVASGLLLVGSDCVVQPGSSASCSALLGISDPTTMTFAACLGLSGIDAEDLEVGLLQVFDDILPECLTFDQLPAKVRRADRVLRLAYGVVREDGEVKAVLVTMSDITDQVVAEAAARRAQTLVAILTQLPAFRLFVDDVRVLLADAREGLVSGDQALVRRAVHTVKGNASVHALDSVVAVVHAVESKEAIGELEIAAVEHSFEDFLEENRSVLGISPVRANEGSVRYEITREHLAALVAAAGGDGAVVEPFLATLRMVPAAQLVAPLEAAVARVAERLEKDVSVRVLGGDVMVDPLRMAPLFRCLPHLVRNSVDHGIEAPSERRGKPAAGCVTLAFEDLGDAWMLTISDDGRGIDPAAISRMAAARGLIPAGRVLDLDEAIEVVTKNAVSTAATVTEISGRGMGLAAMKEALDRMDGALSVESKIGEGTTFRLSCPKR